MPCGSTPEVFQSAGADSLAQATGLTLLEQDFEWLAAIPSDSGEGVYEGLRYSVTVRNLATEIGPTCSRERSRAATPSASTFAD
jgi:hypothetical protein